MTSEIESISKAPQPQGDSTIPNSTVIIPDTGERIVQALLMLSKGHNAQNHYVEDYNPTYEEFTQRLANPSEGGKHGEYYTRGCCVGGVRNNASMETASLLIIDGDKSIDPDTGVINDDTCVPIDKAVRALTRLGYEFMVHTSHSHDPDNGIYKWRAIIRVDRLLTSRAELVACVNYIHHQLHDLGCMVHQVHESAVWSQPWYFSRVDPSRADAFEFHSKAMV